MGSKVRRVLHVDGDVSRQLDRLAEATGYSPGVVATQLLREGIQLRERQLAQATEGLAYAGLGTAMLVLLQVFMLLLA